MTGTSTTNTEPGVVAHALRALADHIERHQLPTPAEFQLDDDTRRLELHLSGCDAERWWTPLRIAGCVEDVRSEPAGRGVEWMYLDARLPDSGVRVRLQWIRRRNGEPLLQRLVTA